MAKQSPVDGQGNMPLLQVSNLRTEISTKTETVRAVDGVSFSVDRGEIVCIVGESGSGKSVTCESITRIIPQPPASIRSGTVSFDGTPLSTEENALRSIRGDQIAHIFQNPQQSLDSVYTVGAQIMEAIRMHRDVSRREARAESVTLLREVGIANATARIDDYPHQFSGGMKQRIAIAIALASDPALLIADEPTTAVDVTVQARLLELFDRLSKGGMSILLVTHNLRVVAALADRVLVMYGGTIVERGPTAELFDEPAHPYTQDLFESYGSIDNRKTKRARREIPTAGCRFQNECPFVVPECTSGAQPAFVPVTTDSNHTVSCVYYGESYESNPIRNKDRTTDTQQTEQSTEQ